jgi:hypothetical protein
MAILKHSSDPTSSATSASQSKKVTVGAAAIVITFLVVLASQRSSSIAPFTKRLASGLASAASDDTVSSTDSPSRTTAAAPRLASAVDASPIPKSVLRHQRVWIAKRKTTPSRFLPALCELDATTCRACTGTNASGCFTGCSCDLPGCIVVDGHCVVNVLDAHTDKLRLTDEVECTDRGPHEQLPQGSDPVSVFKRRTAWMFKRWWDWEATCDVPTAERPAERGGRLWARHDMQHDYVLDNVCINAMGFFSGYEPTLEPFYGRDEVWSQDPLMTRFLKGVEKMDARPTCLVDANLILVFMDARVSNTVHSFSRYLAAELLRQYRFPRPGDPHHPGRPAPPEHNATYPKVVVGFVGIDGYPFESGNAFRYYYPALGDAWFSVFGLTPTHDDIKFAKLEGRVKDKFDVLRKTQLCFRRAYVSYACHHAECEHPFSDYPGRRYHTAFFEHRTGYDRFVLNWARERFAQCLGITPKPTNTTNPLVVVSYRTRSRYVEDLNLNAFPFAAHMIANHNATVVLLEHVRLSPTEVLRLHLSADVVIGMFGAGLGWAVFGPPHAVLIVTVGANWGCPGTHHQRGFFNPIACEYGGWAAARDMRHYNAIVPSGRDQSTLTYRISTGGWIALGDLAMCALRWRGPVGHLGNDSGTIYSEAAMRQSYRVLIRDCERGVAL